MTGRGGRGVAVNLILSLRLRPVDDRKGLGGSRGGEGSPRPAVLSPPPSEGGELDCEVVEE